MNYEEQGRAVTRIWERYAANEISAQDMIDQQNALMPPCAGCARACKVRLRRWALCEACHEAVVKIAGLGASEDLVWAAIKVLKRRGH
jgi:hypothetical protein